MTYNPSAYGYCPHCFGGNGNHKAGCPNETVDNCSGLDCDICGEPIMIDDHCFVVEDAFYHTECFENEHLHAAESLVIGGGVHD